MILKPKTQEIYDYLKAHGKSSMEDMVEATGRQKRSISGSITALSNQKFAIREEIDGIVYVSLTTEGLNFVPSEE